MKKIYINTIGIAFGALLFFTGNAKAQRGGTLTNAGEGTSTATQAAPPPRAVEAAPQRSSPQQQNTFTPPPQRAPQQLQPAPQQQSTYTPPQQQPQRTPQQTYTPPQQQQQPRSPQQNNTPQQNNGYNPSRGNYGGGNQAQPGSSQPRGGYNSGITVATPNTPNNGGGPQRGGNNYNGPDRRGNNGNIAPQRPGNYNGYRGNYNPRRIGANGAYQSYPGLEYGRNRITTPPRGLYYRNRGYYGTYYAPQIGYNLNALPYGYYPFYWGQSLYYYSDGLYYQRNTGANNYTVVEPPIGAEIKSLPDDAQSIIINGIQYYESNGVYYQPVKKDDGTVIYQIAGKDGELNTDNTTMDEPPLRVGELVDRLPEEYRKVKLNGQKYYITEDGYYFQDAVDSNGNKVYRVAGVPYDEDEEK